ncbi:hypothetical protein [Pseudophaeobacter sp. EL27]|uniref:hypothetical protein n=1 Tax=Pseudophaeobacter sp. EL27 TaxID=2107580 RepID=UPI000EFCE17D|nr:hypothetical protein [Pseudophaeobacter sp. EL27]
MAPFILGAALLVVGAFLAACEVRACAYERKNTGPFLACCGAAYLVGAALNAFL